MGCYSAIRGLAVLTLLIMGVVMAHLNEYAHGAYLVSLATFLRLAGPVNIRREGGY